MLRWFTVGGSTPDVTRLLLDAHEGDRQAGDRLMELVYDELRRKAVAYLRRERPGHTLQPTALVHETYLRMVDQKRVVWQNKAHFLGVAASMMRRVLMDHARGRGAAKRGGGGTRVTLDEGLAVGAPGDLDLLALDEALDELEQLEPRHRRIVELRAFGGLSVEEAAEVMDLSPATVKRDWAFARAWLARRLGSPQAGSGSVPGH